MPQFRQPDHSGTGADFRKLRLYPGCEINMDSTQTGVRFVISRQGRSFMAFFFVIPAWEVDGKKSMFAKLLGGDATAAAILSNAPAERMDMWVTNSTLRENYFWAAKDLTLNITPAENGAALIFGTRSGLEFAEIRFPGRACDDSVVLDSALTIREALHIRDRIRVESIYGHQKLCWYIPSFGK